MKRKLKRKRVRVRSKDERIFFDDRRTREIRRNEQRANPVEVLLSSLGGCMSMVGTVLAKEMDLELEDFNLKVEGDLDPRGFQGTADVPLGFQEIRLKIEEIEGVPDEKMDEFIEGIEKRCPVEDTLGKSLEVEIES